MLFLQCSKPMALSRLAFSKPPDSSLFAVFTNVLILYSKQQRKHCWIFQQIFYFQHFPQPISRTDHVNPLTMRVDHRGHSVTTFTTTAPIAIVSTGARALYLQRPHSQVPKAGSRQQEDHWRYNGTGNSGVWPGTWWGRTAVCSYAFVVDSPVSSSARVWSHSA